MSLGLRLLRLKLTSAAEDAGFGLICFPQRHNASSFPWYALLHFVSDSSEAYERDLRQAGSYVQ